MNNVVALATRSLHITPHITVPEVIHELERREDGSARESFARHALRLGVLALQQTNGALDADVNPREGDQLLASVNAVLQHRTSELSGSLAQTMLKYLEPTSGALAAHRSLDAAERRARRNELLDQEAARAGDVGDHVGAVPRRLTASVNGAQRLSQLLEKLS